jgi:hypothetical protein
VDVLHAQVGLRCRRLRRQLCLFQRQELRRGAARLVWGYDEELLPALLPKYHPGRDVPGRGRDGAGERGTAWVSVQRVRPSPSSRLCHHFCHHASRRRFAHCTRCTYEGFLPLHSPGTSSRGGTSCSTAGTTRCQSTLRTHSNAESESAATAHSPLTVSTCRCWPPRSLSTSSGSWQVPTTTRCHIVTWLLRSLFSCGCR